jgi:hypothetical protein
LGAPPSAEGLLSLRSRTPQELQDAFMRFARSFDRVVEFLREQFKIGHLSYVPYEGQLLVLFRAVGMDEAQSQEEIEQLKRWFWAVGFNESLRGKPDHYVVRAVDNWRSVVAGNVRGLEPRLRLSDADFYERRLIRGKALSSAFVTMFAAQDAKSLISGAPIPTSLYMTAPNLSPFVTLATTATLRDVGIEVGPSPRIFPNILLTSPLEEVVPGPPDWVKLVLANMNQGRWDVLHSQFIDEAACMSLALGEIDDFLHRRAAILRSAAAALTIPPVDG